MNSYEFQTIAWRKKEIKYKMSTIITDIILSVIHDINSKYKKVEKHENGLPGILMFLFGIWVWCWLNTVNTNYSCIYLIIKYINKNFERKITLDDLLYKTEDTLLYFKDCLEKSKQYLFTPGSPEFTEMFFITQNTWTLGKFSELSVFYTIIKNSHNPIKINFYSNRGDLDDMFDGKDYSVTDIETNKIYFCQNKKLSNNGISRIDEKYYYFNIFYDEKKYSKLDVLTIDTKDKIYRIKISEDQNDCGNYYKDFRVKKELVREMNKEKNEITELLYDLNEYCYKNKIPFHYIIDNDAEKNSIEELIDNNERVIKLVLTDIIDENLFDLLSNFLSKLKS